MQVLVVVQVRVNDCIGRQARTLPTHVRWTFLKWEIARLCLRLPVFRHVTQLPRSVALYQPFSQIFSVAVGASTVDDSIIFAFSITSPTHTPPSSLLFPEDWTEMTLHIGWHTRASLRSKWRNRVFPAELCDTLVDLHDLCTALLVSRVMCGHDVSVTWRGRGWTGDVS